MIAAKQRTGKKLILATKPFEAEQPARSWFELLITFVVYGGSMTVVLLAPWLALKIAAAFFGGLVQFRMFSLYHDHNHGSLLTTSKLGTWIMSAVGVFILTPRAVWKETHNFHHWNNGKLEWTTIGSYPVMTTEKLAESEPAKVRAYRRTRHWLSLLGGYFTVGIGGMCLSAFRRNPKRHWVGPAALVLHIAVFFGLLAWLGLLTALLVWILPIFTNHALASYLFYSQHNFPESRFYPRGTWNYTDAALRGSSFMVMGPLMRWLTANIGFHHIHHLNSKIPGYRLPEAMAALEELQSPHITSFHPRDVLACLRLDTWDTEAERMRPAKPPVAPADAGS